MAAGALCVAEHGIHAALEATAQSVSARGLLDLGMALLARQPLLQAPARGAAQV